LIAGWRSDSAWFAASWWNPAANGWTLQQARPGLDVPDNIGLLLLFGLAMVGPLFAQTGWANVTFAGGEVANPARNLPRALLRGALVVVTIYLLTNVAYVVTLPLASIQNAPQ